jgi:alpha-1,2-mannosyltransferase
MAAGLIVVAHDSGGPKLDIVVEWEGRPTGFLASDPVTYADCFKRIAGMETESRRRLIYNARCENFV